MRKLAAEVFSFLNNYLSIKRMILSLSLTGLVFWMFCLPRNLFTDPLSTVIEDNRGGLLGARIAADGQWRFPQLIEIPEKFETALLTFEDRHFYYHPGVSPFSMIRALIQNLSRRKRISGGSTLSMQVIRLSRKGKPRDFFQKAIETFMATRLELRHSKKEILSFYASNAPFGGNVVGLDAASWRFFGRSPSDLGWAEAATLAVLPNAPSLIFPGKNHDLLLSKRNRLLDKMHARGLIDSLTCELSKMEPLPEKPFPLPQHASHLLDRFWMSNTGQRIRTTIDPTLQTRTHNILQEYYRVIRANLVHNAATIIIDVKTGEVLAYVGNISDPKNKNHGHMVDVIPALRSTGSILKPFLYIAMTQEGEILPNMLVPDIPTQIAGYTPKNYFLTYDGAVPAKRSLSRSLNVPSVRMLRSYGVEKLHHFLKKSGMTSLVFSPRHYGLTLVLGGAEGSLWEMSGIYASMSRILRNHYEYYGKYDPNDIHPPVLVRSESIKKPNLHDNGEVSAAAIWLAWEALVEVNRPESESNWEILGSRSRIAWKTGTSFGGRDAWAIGTTRDHVVGVWVGNATGEGRPELTGLGSAAPIMFELFGLLPQSHWFEQPFGEMELVPICRNSGHRAGIYCQVTDSQWIHSNGLETEPCPYHQLVHLDKSLAYRVHGDCEPASKIVSMPWFVLPTAMEWFYKSRNPTYLSLPPWRPDCMGGSGPKVMEMIYPRENLAIFIPRKMDGSHGQAIFEVAHRRSNVKIFWHIDDQYIGETKGVHKMAISPGPGHHTLTLVDEEGNILQRAFEVVSQ